MINIAVLLTCHNRCDKTLSCLKSLFEALDDYNVSSDDMIMLKVYLTDDGCTDGTADAVRDGFHGKDIMILQGDGNLFWAGGMRLAWNAALKRHEEWDGYLLLNDDTDLFPNLFVELFKTGKYCVENYGKIGVISGITCSKSDHAKMTYGGDVWVNKFLAKQKRLQPSSRPQMCDMTNANIMFVPKKVVDEIGIFDSSYVHGAADYCYSATAREHDIPVVITAEFCGACDNDHVETSVRHAKIASMSLSERKRYFSFPPTSGRDHLTFMKKHAPFRVPFVWLGRKMEKYIPKLYYFLYSLR